MMNKKVLSALNDQVGFEYDSAYLYLSMTAWLHNEGWDGMAHWVRKQYSEEIVHAEKIFDYIVSRNGKISIASLEKPKGSWNAPLDLFKEVLKHEEAVTARIHALVKLSIESADYATQSFLTWFVDEQVEEEAQATKVVSLLEKIGSSTGSLLMIDKQLGKRGVEKA